jgi:predicted ATPase
MASVLGGRAAAPPTGEFVRRVRSALVHAHDLAYLETHPLAALAGGGRALRRHILDAIGSLDLARGPGGSGGTHGRTQQLLNLRYADGLTSREVAARLAISQGEYYREHRVGVAALARVLATVLDREAGAGAAGETRATRGEAPADAGNLPAGVTSFVGREHELATVADLLSSARLCTLVGVGGVGKTRLGLEAARRLSPRFADGVWFVDLAPLAEPALVPAAALAALGLQEAQDIAAVATLCRHLRGRTALLLLDNCEHLLEASTQLAGDVLRACPGVCVIATSREVLGLPGEAVVRVPPFSVPQSGAGHAGTIETLLAYEASRLFVERAHLAAPDVELRPEDVPAVVRICRRLDGIPLALELAASRLRILAAGELADRLDDAFRLLDGGRVGGPRHQTLRAAVDWSYQLLADCERSLFARLSVFAGGWTLGAAASVCGEESDGASAGGVVLERLAALVDKSLVVAETRPDGTRYRLLETLRQYGAQKLAAAGEAAAIRDRHAACYLSLARGSAERLRGGEDEDPDTWLAMLEAEHDNLRAVIDWLTASGRLEAAVRACQTLAGFWTRRGHAREGQARLERVLAEPGWRDESARVDALLTAAALAWARADVPAQQRLAESALEASRAAGYRRGEVIALARLGMAAGYRGEYAAARAFEAEARALARAGGEPWSPAHQLGNVARDEGDFACAWQVYERALAHQRERCDRTEVGHVLSNMGWLALFEGELERSHRLQSESLAIRRADRDGREIAVSTTALGLVALAAGDRVGAWEQLATGLRGHLDLGNLWGIALSLEGFAGLAAGGEPTAALRLAGAAEKLREAMQRPVPRAARGLVDGWLTPARTALTEEVRAREWARGRALGHEAAGELALNLAAHPAGYP